MKTQHEKANNALHNAAEKLEVETSNELLKKAPGFVIQENEDGDTPCHSLLRAIFSEHPDRYTQQGIKLLVDLLDKMIQTSPKMRNHLGSLFSLSYHSVTNHYGYGESSTNHYTIKDIQLVIVKHLNQQVMDLNGQKDIRFTSRLSELEVQEKLLEATKKAYIVRPDSNDM